MFPWNVFKYVFGRFFCWHTFVLTGFVVCIDPILRYIYFRNTETLKNIKSSDEILSKVFSNPECITKYFTWTDIVIILLVVSLCVIIFYYSIVLATKRTLFYPYNYIKLTVPFNKKTPWKHLMFILSGILFADYFPTLAIAAINDCLPNVLVENNLALHFTEACFAVSFYLTCTYFVLQLYFDKNVSIEWIHNNKNKGS